MSGQCGKGLLSDEWCAVKIRLVCSSHVGVMGDCISEVRAFLVFGKCLAGRLKLVINLTMACDDA